MFLSALFSLACTGTKDSAQESLPTTESESQESQPQESQPKESEPHESLPNESQPVDCNQSPSIVDFGGNCSGGTCTWTIESDFPMGEVAMTLVQTGDPAGTCGPSKGGVTDCGVWYETHERFTTTESIGECGEKKSIELEVVEIWTDQIDNQSTLFDTVNELSQLTVLTTITDPNGTYTDCMVKGEDPSYFSAECQ